MEQKLGRGLSALLGDSETPTNSEGMVSNKINIDLIVPNANQPRKIFDDNKLQELANSISLHGVLQPIAVRKVGDKYEIIAGERRWRASKLAGLREVPVYIVDCDDSTVMALALIENLQRADLNPIEEAEAMKNLMITCECRQEDVGAMLSKSRSYVANALRLLSLPPRVRDLIRTGRLSASHAKNLVGVQNAEEIADLAVANNWNVRQLEMAMKDLKCGTVSSSMPVVRENPRTSAGTPIDMTADPETIDIAIRVAEALKVETKLKVTRRGGVFTLICKSCEELEDLVNKLVSLGDN